MFRSDIKNAPLGLLCLVIIIFVLGCGFVDRLKNTATAPVASNSNKTLTDKAVDTTVGESRIGVPECDEVMDMLAAEANNPDDGFVTKAVKATFLNRIRDAIRQSVEENKGDSVELAKTCRDLKAQLEKFKAEQEANK